MARSLVYLVRGGGALLRDPNQWKDDNLQEEDDDVCCELPVRIPSSYIF